MKSFKTTFPYFAAYDRRGIETYLEKQAEKGWMFLAFGTIGWKFKRIEPKKLHFAVSYFQNVSAFDTVATPELQTYREFCAHAGWRFLDSSEKMQIFCSEAEDPTPIDSDALIEIACIHKAERKKVLSGVLRDAIPLVTFLLAILISCASKKVISSLSSQGSGAAFILAVALLLRAIVRVMEYYIWYWGARKKARQDSTFLSMKGIWLVSRSGSLIIFGSCLLVMLLMNWVTVLVVFLSIALLIVAAILAFEWIKSKSYDRKTTMILVLVASFVLVGIYRAGVTLVSKKINLSSEIHFTKSKWSQYEQTPLLSAQEMYGTDTQTKSYQDWVEESIFLAHYNVRMDAEAEEQELILNYSVLEVKFGVLYDLCLEEYLAQQARYMHENGETDTERYFTVDASCWGADLAYRYGCSDDNCRNLWLLCYDGRIVEIQLSEEPTPEQMALVGEVLGN